MLKKICLMSLSIMFAKMAFALPDGFVYLSGVDPTIQVELRYASENNFLGRKVEGYNSKDAVILTYEAALALQKAQEKFKKDGYSIVVYDAYRPQRAVNDFILWAKDQNDQKNKSLFYPRVDKAKVFELGYIVEKSGHSRGSTVDISIIKINHNLHKIKPKKRRLADGFEVMYLDDGTVDMGTSFDLFDKASHFVNSIVTEKYKKNREYLRHVMESCGFKGYSEEWWHFTLEDEPFKDTYWDFVIQ